MSEEYLVNYCAPTMAGIKTGSLFSCFYRDDEELRADLRRYNQIFMPKGLFLIPLKTSGKRVLLYLFRRDKLQNDLCGNKVGSMLRSIGYDTDDYRSCLTKLIRKLKNSTEFPHEIGLFLSYPPEDVKGFVTDGADNYKLVGYWKVYSNVNAAKRTFREYDHCTLDYSNRVKKGLGIESLIVA